MKKTKNNNFSNTNNPLISNEMNNMFNDIAKQAGVDRFSEEYNELIWNMIFILSGE